MSEQNQVTNQNQSTTQNQGTTNGGTGVTTTPPAFNFDDWLKGQSDDVKRGIEGHISGLKTALSSERSERDRLEKSLRETAAKAEKGSDLEKQLLAQADQLKAASNQTAFYEQAHAAGVKNLRLAWLAATADDKYIKRNGDVDFESLKRENPELFGTTQQVTTNGGTQNVTPATTGGTVNQKMNEAIRSAAGYTTVQR